MDIDLVRDKDGGRTASRRLNTEGRSLGVHERDEFPGSVARIDTHVAQRLSRTLAWFFLGEVPTTTVVLGGCLVFFGVLFAQRVGPDLILNG